VFFAQLKQNMKSNLLPICAVLATVSAVAFLPLGAAAGLGATLAGLIAILHADYGRNMEPLRPAIKVASFDQVGSEQFELAQAA
jgi:hypothetical protein